MKAKLVALADLNKKGKDKVEFFIEGELGPSSSLLKKGVKIVSVGDYLQQMKDRVEPKRLPDQSFNYLSLSNIASNKGDLLESSPTLGSEIRSSCWRFNPGEILYARMRPYLNKVWLADATGICSTEFFVLQRKATKEIDSTYIQTMLLDQVFLSQVVSIQVGSSRPRVMFEDFKDLKIVVPPPDVINRVSATMRTAKIVRKRLLEESNQEFQSLYDMIPGMLGVKLAPRHSNARSFLKDMQSMPDRHDVKWNEGYERFKDCRSDLCLKLRDVLDFVKEQRNPTKSPGSEFEYIDIASLDVASGEIMEPTRLTGREAPSRARKVVRHGEIIISTVRPARGAIAVVPEHLDGQICSTGFAVTRPKPSFDLDYVFYALRSTSTLEQLDRGATGSSYPAVLESDIADCTILVPERTKQEEIARHLSERRKKAIAHRQRADDTIMKAQQIASKMLTVSTLSEEEVNFLRELEVQKDENVKQTL